MGKEGEEQHVVNSNGLPVGRFRIILQELKVKYIYKEIYIYIFNEIKSIRKQRSRTDFISIPTFLSTT